MRTGNADSNKWTEMRYQMLCNCEQKVFSAPLALIINLISLTLRRSLASARVIGRNAAAAAASTYASGN